MSQHLHKIEINYGFGRVKTYWLTYDDAIKFMSQMQFTPAERQALLKELTEETL